MLLLLLSLVSQTALQPAAQPVTEPASRRSSPFVAQPVALVGFDFSMYRPGIDRALDGATPYADLFGASRRPLYGGHAGVMLGLGDHVALTLTLGVSHFGASAYAFVDDGDDATPASGDDRSGGQTSLDVTPWSLLLGARYTGLWRKWRAPVVPYAELGPTVAAWSIARGDGSTAVEGATLGLSFGTGVLFELIGLDAKASAALADDFGIRSVALRAGLLHHAIDGLGAANALVLSDTTWSAGLELGF